MVRKNKTKQIIAAAGTVGTALTVFAASLFYSNINIKIRTHEFVSKTTKTNVNIVHLSDLHNYNYGEDNKILINKIKNLNPDIIVMTGDMIDAHYPDIKETKRLFIKLTSICRCVYIEGNHEEHLKLFQPEEYKRYIETARALGVIVLKNEAFEVPDTNIVLYGLKSRPDATILNSINNSKYNIVLNHDPVYSEELSENNPDLILSGHTHGGQVNIPFIGPLFTHGQGLKAKYISGKWNINKTTLIISNGLGSSKIHPIKLRFNVSPEIVNIKINKES